MPRLPGRSRFDAARDRTRVGARARGACFGVCVRAQAAHTAGSASPRRRLCRGHRLAICRDSRRCLQGPRGGLERSAWQQWPARRRDGASIARPTHFDSLCADPLLTQSATDLAARRAQQSRGLLSCLSASSPSLQHCLRSNHLLINLIRKISILT